MSLDGKCTEELLGLLTQHNFAYLAETLANHEVFSVEDADCMTQEDVQEWELPDNFNDFLEYVHSYFHEKHRPPRTPSPHNERGKRDIDGTVKDRQMLDLLAARDLFTNKQVKCALAKLMALGAHN